MALNLNIIPLLTGAFLSITLVSSPHAWAAVTGSVRGESVSASDMAVLPPLCKLIMENEGIHHSVGQVKNAAVFEQPQYHMAKGNEHIHHYCWALISKQRYFRERSPAKRQYYFREFMGDINYVLKHSAKSWPYFDVMLAEQGQMLMIRGDHQAAIQKANEALTKKSDSEAAYLLLFDANKAAGNKSAAIKAAQTGLEKNPDSDRLRRRLVKAGVAVPPRPAPAPVPEEPSTAETPLAPASPQIDPGASIAPAQDASNAPPQSTTPNAAESTSDQAQTTPKNNPYCRFCP